MYDSLIAKIAAGMLAGLVTFSMLAGIDTLAVNGHAGTALAKGKHTPALLAAQASAPVRSPS